VLNLNLEGFVLAKSFPIYGVTPVLNTFFGVSIDASQAKYVVLGVPFDETSSFRRGSKKGPEAIRDASQHIESFCLFESAKIDAAKLPIADIGDIVVSPVSVQGMLESMESIIGVLAQKQQTIILLGGEHSLTLGAVRALPRDIIVVQFDAHMDLRETLNGTPFSHACVMRRIVEQLGADQLIQVGIHAVAEEEYEFAKENNVNYITIEDISKYGVQATIERINKAIPPGPPIYISVDMDVLDPAFAPAVGNPEAGGLMSQELFSLIRALAPRSIGLDVTEVAPQYDQGQTALCAAKVVKTFLCAKASFKR
jgi:agmatinase